MFLLFALVGLGLGWLMNRASDYLPRFAVDQPGITTSTWPGIALLQIARREPNTGWLRLHAISEAASAVVLAFLWLRLGASWTLLSALAVYLFFALVTLIDIKYRLVLNIFVYPAVLVVLLAQVLLAPQSLTNVLLGGAFAFGVFYSAARVRPNGLGAGDVKLATLIGLLFGFPGILYALLIAAGATGLVTAAILISGRGGLDTQIPFAPFLCLAALAVLLLNPLWIVGGLLL